jgi:AcrR family transcriptional regulator
MTASARREQLLDVTLTIVAEQGFQAVSIESVARSAGISRPIVYQHFGDLQGLLEAVVEREMTRARSQVSETAMSDLTEGEPRQLMLESLRSYLHAVRDHPTTWRLVLMPPQGAPELLRKSVAQGRSSVRAQMTAAVRPALLRDRESPDAELTARVLSAISDEYARLVLTDPERFTPERLLAHAGWWLDQAALTGGGHGLASPLEVEREIR